MAIRRTSPINIVQTWDDAEKKFSSFRIDIATSGFAGGNAASRAFEIVVDGTTVFGINSAGNMTAGGGVQAPVSLTTTPIAIAPATHAGRKIVLNKADGIVVTLPAATGSGAEYHFIVGTTSSGGTYIIKVTTDDTMKGLALGLDDDGVPANAWAASGTSDTITMDGTTRGGVVGDECILRDIAVDVWQVQCHLQQSGTEATPFSATVT